MDKYNPQDIENKWQKKWKEDGLYKTPTDATKENKMYILPQLPYPSGSGLHVGHAEVYAACDIFARYQRMKQKKVLQVIGWDSFGLPAENYAIKTNVHPRKSTDEAINNFRAQIKSLGISVDWDREVGAHHPDYYKWTQWFFLLFYKRGLAYRKMQSVNWCDSCKTVLANDQVKDGHCERCDTLVVQREMEQWFLKITEYADRLLEGLDRIDWPEETKKRQRDWIGRSEGASVKFKVEGEKNLEIDVFTTRPDTLFGATYMVLGPEHKLIQTLKSDIENWKEVEKYIKKASKKTELERQSEKEKTGVELKGVKAINPANGEQIPVWVADYVLASYGTGAIMAVPAHDERDWEFATHTIPLEAGESSVKYIKCVVEPKSYKELIPHHKYLYELKDGQKYEDVQDEQAQKDLQELRENRFCYPGVGIAVNSDFLNGLPTKEAKEKMIAWLEEHNVGKRKVQYKLRDWSVSRQRFWGAPIPMLFNEKRKAKSYKYILLHGYKGSPDSNFFPWLKKELEARGHSVVALDLPNTDMPNVKEQAKYVLKQTTLNKDTVIVAHSLGGPVAFRVLEALEEKVAKVVLVDPVLRPEFNDGDRPDVSASDSFEFDFKKIKQASDEFVLLADAKHVTIKKEHIDELQNILDCRMVTVQMKERHFMEEKIDAILDESIVSGLMPVSEEDLPVLLPDDVDFKPTGQSPLTYSEEFQKGVEETYGKGWKREVDTLDTFMCSSWYYYRYLDPKNDGAFASPEALKQWMPVDFYLGGEEHVNGHLLYSRFFTKVLFDAGYIDFSTQGGPDSVGDEPFTKHRHQGLILGPDHRKMSKRWDNVVNPTDVINEYGADTLRMYEMFMGPLEQTKPWDTNGVKGIRRFLEKVWGLLDLEQVDFSGAQSIMHKTIKKVHDDIKDLKFNTAIAQLMIWVNTLREKGSVTKEELKNFILILSPFAPHISEEMWSRIGQKRSVCEESWPDVDPSKIIEIRRKIAIQVNGKVRATVEAPADISEDEAKALALEQPNVEKWLEGREPKKVIYVKGKLVSIVV